MCVFYTWRDNRNEHCEDKCPMDLLEKPTIPFLIKWLLAFAVEFHREDGQRYSATIPSANSFCSIRTYNYTKYPITIIKPLFFLQIAQPNEPFQMLLAFISSQARGDQEHPVAYASRRLLP